MNVGIKSINTPFIALGDDPMSARGNWVHEIAKAAVDTSTALKSLPTVLRNSPEYPVIEKHAKFLATPESALYGKANKDLRLHKIASRWAERADGPRIYIDAMLLGGKAYKDIAAALDDGRADKKDTLALVKLYETLFLHCRRTDGSMLPKPQLLSIALEGRPAVMPADPEYIHWRVKAATQGIELVEPLWGEEPADLAEFESRTNDSARMQVHREIEIRVRCAGSEKTEDLVSVAAHFEAIRKRESDERIGSTAADSAESAQFELIQGLLALAVPEREPVEAYKKPDKETVAADKRNLASTKKISKTVVVDHGPAGSHAAIDKTVKKHVAKGTAKQEKPVK